MLEAGVVAVCEVDSQDVEEDALARDAVSARISIAALLVLILPGFACLVKQTGWSALLKLDRPCLS